MIRLGQKVRDVVTGFVGIAETRMEWLNGCVRISVQPQATTSKDKGDLGRQYVPDSKSFDEEQLEIIDENPIRLPGHNTPALPHSIEPIASGRVRRTGGGRPDPQR